MAESEGIRPPEASAKPNAFPSAERAIPKELERATALQVAVGQIKNHDASSTTLQSLTSGNSVLSSQLEETREVVQRELYKGLLNTAVGFDIEPELVGRIVEDELGEDGVYLLGKTIHEESIDLSHQLNEPDLEKLKVIIERMAAINKYSGRYNEVRNKRGEIPTSIEPNTQAANPIEGISAQIDTNALNQQAEPKRSETLPQATQENVESVPFTPFSKEQIFSMAKDTHTPVSIDEALQRYMTQKPEHMDSTEYYYFQRNHGSFVEAYKALGVNPEVDRIVGFLGAGAHEVALLREDGTVLKLAKAVRGHATNSDYGTRPYDIPLVKNPDGMPFQGEISVGENTVEWYVQPYVAVLSAQETAARDEMQNKLTAVGLELVDPRPYQFGRDAAGQLWTIDYQAVKEVAPSFEELQEKAKEKAEKDPEYAATYRLLQTSFALQSADWLNRTADEKEAAGDVSNVVRRVAQRLPDLSPRILEVFDDFVVNKRRFAIMRQQIVEHVRTVLDNGSLQGENAEKWKEYLAGFSDEKK